jgi:hypothetical protein
VKRKTRKGKPRAKSLTAATQNQPTTMTAVPTNAQNTTQLSLPDTLFPSRFATQQAAGDQKSTASAKTKVITAQCELLCHQLLKSDAETGAKSKRKSPDTDNGQNHRSLKQPDSYQDETGNEQDVGNQPILNTEYFHTHRASLLFDC